MKTLQTERLILRPWQESDLDDFYEYARDPEIGPNAGWEPHTNREASRSILQLFVSQNEVWAIEHQQDGKAIGSIGLHMDRKRSGVNARMLGYVLARQYWGQGLMTEAARCAIRYAFEELQIDILSVYHYPHNMKSRRVIEKCGFRYEGTLRSASRIYDGTVMDDVCYSILKEEYISGKIK